MTKTKKPAEVEAAETEKTTKAKSVRTEDQKQYDKIQKLKAVAFNRGLNQSFVKLDKKISMSDLQARKNLPEGFTFESEFVMSNGQVFNFTSGLINKFVTL